MDLGLRHRTALVTGSTSGLGLACAQALSDEGARVVICGRRGDLAVREAAALQSEALGVQADLTDPDAARMIVDATSRRFAPPDILVVSTGGPPIGTALDTPADAFEEAVRSLVAPVVRLSQLVATSMMEAGWGRIVFVTSTVVREPAPMLVLSDSIRMAVHGYAKALSKQVAPCGVTVNCVMPGRISTDRIASLDQMAASATNRNLQDVQSEAAAAIPAGRYGRPQEFAAVVAFLCSDKAAYVNGAAVAVDGGALAGH